MVASSNAVRVCSRRCAWVRCAVSVTAASLLYLQAGTDVHSAENLHADRHVFQQEGPVPLQLPKSSWSTTELEDLRELSRSFLQKEAVPHQERWAAEKKVDRELWTKAGDVGLLCLSIPEEYGGGGGTFAHEAVLYEEQARSGDSAWGVSVHN